MSDRLIYSTSTHDAATARWEAAQRRQHAGIAQRIANAAYRAEEREAEERARTREPVTGRCTACGSREVTLTAVALHADTDGTPSGWGCEVCD